MTRQILSILATFFTTTLLYFLGTPDGLNPNAWLYFCIFIDMIIGLVLEPVPPGLIALSVLVLCVALKIGASNEATSANKAISWGLSELCLAPFIPSNSARSGGILYPIVSSIPPLMGPAPNNNPDKIGAYLMRVALASTCITSSMFLSVCVPWVKLIAYRWL